MFTYNIAKHADEETFYRVCERIESRSKIAEKKPLLEDVDGTLIQLYSICGKEIKVVNDCEIDAVFVDSEINMEQIL